MNASRASGPVWLEQDPVPAERVARLEEALGLPAAMCQILLRRGYAEPEEARRFLRPELSDLHDPRLLPDMDRAIDRVEAAIRSGETILVHGDYDVDGMSAAALLGRALEDIGARVIPFVPDRADGYDLGTAGLEEARRVGASLIVTADCGVSAHDAIRRAGAMGIDVVVTDHHQPGSSLPEAAAVVNPNRPDARYPFRGLAGVGVAFKLVSELFRIKGVPEERLNQHLDVVALGTVGDLAPLVDENRALVKLGLAALARTRKFGLQALLWVADLRDADRLQASDIGFRLAPRLNSAGRIGSAADGLRLLLTRDRDEAVELARKLDRENVRRRLTDRAMLAEAEGRLAGEFAPERDRAIVLWSESWHPGVLGITASRLAERLHRPTVLVAFDGERGRGSARSIEGFHLLRAIEACAPALDRYGGHAMAAGFDIHRSRLEDFVERFTHYARRELTEEGLRRTLRVDLSVELAELTTDFARRLEYLGPFGVANPRPTLRVNRVRWDRVGRTGVDDRHLRARLLPASGEAESALEAIGFGLGERAPELSSGPPWDVVFRLRRDTWRGRDDRRAHLLDFRSAVAADPERATEATGVETVLAVAHGALDEATNHSG